MSKKVVLYGCLSNKTCVYSVNYVAKEMKKYGIHIESFNDHKLKIETEHVSIRFINCGDRTAIKGLRGDQCFGVFYDNEIDRIRSYSEDPKYNGNLISYILEQEGML